MQDTQSRLAECVFRRSDSDRTILNTSAQVAELFLSKETILEQAAQLIERRDDMARQRSELTALAQTLRQKTRRLQDQVHQQELAAGEIAPPPQHAGRPIARGLRH